MKKGFTLIELLAVIVILAIIALIAVPIVINIIEDAKKSSQEESLKLYGKAVENGVANYLLNHPNDKDITLDKIKDYVKYSGDPIECKTVQINEKGKIYLANCSINNTKVEYTYGEKQRDPNITVDLQQGLTPVIYDGDNWKVVDKNDPNWYDYDEQKWANAVVLGKDKTKNHGDIVTVEGDNPDALMMLVYIPRYEYKIEGDFGKGGQSADLPGEIEVKFINNAQTKADNDYILHPAFVFGNKQLNGFWVGKFELSHTTKSKGNASYDSAANLNCTDETCSEAQNLRILPNKPSLRYNDVSNFFYSIRNIENTSTFGLSKMDTHMMKNSEWGAVAYLSQSKYGKYGNPDYEIKYKEVYQNKDTGYVTGKSNGTPSQETYRNGGQCVYNNMQDLGVDSNGYKIGQCGPGASTTGNIYGVYDMSGGAYEYVMGGYGDSEGIYSGLDAVSNSGFNGRIERGDGLITNGVSMPESKYYDIYKTDNITTACDNKGPCLGHAMSETASWYGDYANNMVKPSYPWFLRGGTHTNITSIAGVFSQFNSVGGSLNDASARFVGFIK